MQKQTMLIYGVDCNVHKTLPALEQALARIKRTDPDLIVFCMPSAPTAGLLDIVRDTYASGCAVMMTPKRLTAPAETDWLEKAVA